MDGYERALVVAARDGDAGAVDRLVAAYLPLVYNVVGRALGGHADVDDVVQETMLRCVTGLRGLRDPERFRSWLVAIAVRQVRDRHADPYRARQSGHLRHPDAGWDPEEVSDPGADFADLTILRLELSGQRREVAEATRWLDDEDRELLALWWLEASGELTRDELAESLGLTNQHAAVRVQRLKARLDAARVVVRALHARPRCPELASLVAGWSGRPDPLWRKRLARHARDCDHCGLAWSQLVAAERLLAGVGLVAPAAGLFAAVMGAGSTAGGLAAGAAGGAAWLAGSPVAAAGSGGFAAPAAGGGLAGAAVAGPGVAHASAGAVRASAGWLPRLLAAPAGAKAAVAGLATAAVVAAAVAVTGAGLPDDGGSPAPAAASPPATVAATVTSPPVPSPTSAKPTPTVSARPSPTRTTARPAAPPPARSAPKKGVAVWDFPATAQGLRAVGASWYYNWSPDDDRMPAPSGVEFVPMVWGAANVTDGTLAKVAREGDTLLGFNEPDLAGQADMTPAEALALWPRLAGTGLRLGSPAVAWGGADSGGWLDQFMRGARERGLRVDFVALHWYGADFSPAAVGHLERYLRDVHDRYGLPIWLTEFALIRWDAAGVAHYPSDAEQVAFVRGATRMLERLPFVERYAWFGLPATADSPTGLYRAGSGLTAAGEAYRASP